MAMPPYVSRRTSTAALIKADGRSSEHLQRHQRQPTTLADSAKVEGSPNVRDPPIVLTPRVVANGNIRNHEDNFVSCSLPSCAASRIILSSNPRQRTFFDRIDGKQPFVGNGADPCFPSSLSLVETMGKRRGLVLGALRIGVMQAHAMMTWRQNRITWEKQEAKPWSQESACPGK